MLSLVCAANSSEPHKPSPDLATAEASAAPSHEWLEAWQLVANAVVSPKWLKDRAGNYLAINDAYALLLGLPAARVVARSDAQFPAVQDPGATRQHDLAALACEAPLLHAECFVPVRGAPVTWQVLRQTVVENGSVVGLSGEFLPALPKTAEIGPAHSQMSLHFAKVAHDLRAPLAGIASLVEWMAESHDLPEEQKKRLALIDRCNFQALGLAADLLDLGRAQGNAVSLRNECVDTAALFEELLVCVQGSALAKGIEVHMPAPGSYPARLQVDGLRLRQVLLNLLTNAVRHTQVGYVWLTLALDGLHDSDEQKQPAAPLPEGSLRWRFEVIDTGEGMSVEQVQGLFVANASPGNERALREGRSGLGLIVSQEIVHAMGGTLTAMSFVDSGSTFSFAIEA